MKIILLTKKTEYCKIIQKIVKDAFPQTTIFEGEVGEPLPDLDGDWKGDYIISFLAPWIIPKTWLDKAKVSINFHPGPPNYPGTCCYNLAIYHKEKEYGVTCHHMVPEVDSGDLIKVIMFPMYETDSVLTLKGRSMEHLTKLFQEIWKYLVSEKQLPQSKEKWLRKAYNLKDFQKLCIITPDMDEKEVKLRIRATYFPGAKDLPHINLYGNKFICSYESKEKRPKQ